MLNCPGANASAACPSNGSRVMVATSLASRRPRITRKGRGRIGSLCGARAAWPSAADVIDIEELQAGGLQPLAEDLGEALEQLVAQFRILLAFRAQARGVELQGHGDLERARVELLAMRRDEPRPAQHLPGLQRLDHDRTGARHENLHPHLALPDGVKRLRLVALAKDVPSRIEPDIGRTAG